MRSNVLKIIICFIFLTVVFSSVNAQFDQGCPNGYIFNAQGNCVPSGVPLGCAAGDYDPISGTCVPSTTSSSGGSLQGQNNNTLRGSSNTTLQGPSNNTLQGPSNNSLQGPSNRAPNQQITSVFKNPLKADSIIKLLEGLLNVVLQLAVPVVVIFFMWSGFLYIKAQGNQAELGKAHQALLYTTIGTAILFGAFALGKIVQATIETLQNIK